MFYSIIIPTYNSEDTIIRAIESITNQSLDSRHYEIIIVDDGSSDKTIELVENLRYEFMKVIKLSENTGGPSIPRNVGIQESEGQYIYFLDSDDYLEDKILEKVFIRTELHKSDLIIGKSIKVTDQAELIHAKFMSIKERVNQKSIDIPYLYYYLGPHGKFIKKSLLDQNQILFPTNLSFGEDKIFFFHCYEHSQYITTIEDVVGYIDRTRDNQSLITRTKFMEKRYADYALFNEVLLSKNNKVKEKFLLRVIEYDLLKSCKSLVFLNETEQEKVKLFKILSDVLDTKIIKRKVKKKIGDEYNYAIQCIEANDFDSFVKYFEWWVTGAKLFNDFNTLTDKSETYYLPQKYAAIFNIQQDEESVYIQFLVNDILIDKVEAVKFESRTSYLNDFQIKDINRTGKILSISLSKKNISKKSKGIYNVLLIHNEYQAVNIKFGYQFKIHEKSVLYPTKNGNLSWKNL